MSEQLSTLLTQYGYLAIFALIFLQEVGVPNPIPNEFVLLFSGYLCFTGVLNTYLVLLSAITGDLLASFLVFEVFYFFGKHILTKKPKWLPITQEKMDRLNIRINASGQSGTYIGRLTPFIKGYVSVVSGLIRIPQKKYSITLLTTSILWSSAYVTAGYILGPQFVRIYNHPTWMFIIPASALMILLIIHLFKIKKTV